MRADDGCKADKIASQSQIKAVVYLFATLSLLHQKSEICRTLINSTSIGISGPIPKELGRLTNLKTL